MERNIAITTDNMMETEALTVRELMAFVPITLNTLTQYNGLY